MESRSSTVHPPSGLFRRTLTSRPSAQLRTPLAVAGIAARRPEFRFGSKAETLESLRERLVLSVIPEFLYFSVCEWQQNRAAVLEQIRERFDNGYVVIRSSALAEDTACTSLAGQFDSVLNVAVADERGVSAAIERVLASYTSALSAENPADQVLVQRMIRDVSMSGVVFTQDLNTGAPYYVINYDDESGRTDTITSGAQNSNRTLLIQRESRNEPRSPRFRALLSAIREIEQVTESTSLDVEFAVTKENVVCIFQVRQITTKANWNRGLTLRVNDAIDRIRAFVAESQRPIPAVYGSRSVFGRMPDWNPAEMIGTTPQPLAYSLYRRLITDSAWRIARRRMGYAEPVGSPLMVSLAGHPFIDVRLSFHSFLPAQLEPRIASKIVDAWLARLSAHKELHDKVEFEVAATCLSFDFDRTWSSRYPGLLDSGERSQYRQLLLQLTARLLSGRQASITSALESIQSLVRCRAKLMEHGAGAHIRLVSCLLEDCIEHGTIPFSILARHAFIATALLRSLVDEGALGPDEAAAFQRSIRTVAGELVSDLDRLAAGDIGQESFMQRYGHLRPGTYDILSMRYDQRPNFCEGLKQRAGDRTAEPPFEFSARQLAGVDAALKQSGLGVSAGEFFTYARQAVAAREYAKFVFTQNVSDSLEILAAWGERVGLSREELAFLPISDLLDSNVEAHGRTLEQYLRDASLRGRAQHEISAAIRLPHLIDDPDDASMVPLLLHQPNFVTNKSVRGPVLLVDGRTENTARLEGHIVLIENADPGFDWMFSRPFLGLVTKYGGANSHMAIRCAEFGIPAAIGCGEQLFDRILNNSSIELNCGEARIVPFDE